MIYKILLSRLIFFCNKKFTLSSLMITAQMISRIELIFSSNYIHIEVNQDYFVGRKTI